MSQGKKWYLRHEVLIAMLLVAAYFGLVLISINRFGVWHDEGYSAVLIENNYGGIIERTAKDVHPPLYYLALKTWSFVAGDSVMALRLFSAVSMAGAIIVTWRIVRKLHGSKAALVALAFMSVGPFLVRYGQEMRMYGLAALLASLATWLYLRTLEEKKEDWWVYAVYGLVVVAGMYTQYFFVLVPAVHIIHRFFTPLRQRFLDRLKNIKPFLISGIVAALMFAPWVPTVLTQFSEVHGSFWIPKVSVETLTSTPIAMTVLKKQFQMTEYLALLAIVTLVLLIAAYMLYSNKNRSQQSKLLILLVLVPPVLLFLLSLPPFQPSYQDRYMSFMAPIFYSLIGVGVLAISSRKLRTVTIVAFLALFGFGQFNNFREGNNHGWVPMPYFTINNLLDQVDTDEPIYSTSLWTFFDARTMAKDRSMPNTTKVLFGEYPQKWMGNWSAIYDRTDLIEIEIPDNTSGLWLIDESGQQMYWGKELDDFTAGESYINGYAKITHYSKNSSD